MCYFWWDSLFCSCIAHRNFLDLSTLLNWLTVLVTTPFWTLTCLFKHCPTQLCRREQGLRVRAESGTSELRTKHMFCLFCASCIHHLFPCDLVGVVWHFNSSASNVLANSWTRMRGKKMSYSVLTRCSMKTRNSLMSTTSLQCPLFQVLCFLFHSRFVLQDSQSCFLSLHSYHNQII